MTAPPRDGLFYRGKWLWMWPNWTLSLFEGGMNTSRINPIGTGPHGAALSLLLRRHV